MSVALRRAFEMCEERVDVPHLARLESVGVEIAESEAFLRAISGGPLLQRALSTGVEVVMQMAAGELGDEDDQRQAEAFGEWLTDLEDDGDLANGLRTLLVQTANGGLVEGFILGVAYVVMSERAKVNAMRGRPRR